MLKVDDGRAVPGLLVQRPDGKNAQFVLFTARDEEVAAHQPLGGLAVVNLEQIKQAKEALALDAMDGKIDFKVSSLELERPSHFIFFSDNSAKALLLALASGQRKLVYNGKPVEVTAAFKSWVASTQILEGVQPR